MKETVNTVSGKGFHQHRERWVRESYGKVLEIGAGSGANLSWYDPAKVESLVITTREAPSQHLAQRLGLHAPRFDECLHQKADAQSLPYSDNSFDCIVATLVFCSVQTVSQGLAEIARVLKPGGSYIFIEHVRPQGKIAGPIADVCTPAFSKIAGNCHLNRDFEKSLHEAGFVIAESEQAYRDILFAGIAHAQ